MQEQVKPTAQDYQAGIVGCEVQIKSWLRFLRSHTLSNPDESDKYLEQAYELIMRDIAIRDDLRDRLAQLEKQQGTDSS